jgi:hypothetical protein
LGFSFIGFSGGGVYFFQILVVCVVVKTYCGGGAQRAREGLLQVCVCAWYIWLLPH